MYWTNYEENHIHIGKNGGKKGSPKLLIIFYTKSILIFGAENSES